MLGGTTCFPSAAGPASRHVAPPLIDPVRVPDRVIDVAMALKLHAEARRIWSIVGWCVTFDVRQQPGKYVARLLAGEPVPYVLVADTLDDLHASLPPGLMLLPGLPPDQPEIVELWFAR
ncbi:MAG TPA: hypothetical protein VE690_12160 [Rhodopila sp.]|nr:hypothetical protein [Rhodopila sp.]